MKKIPDIEKADRRWVYVHMTRKDYDRIHRKVAQAGMKIGEFLRDRAINCPMKTRHTPEEMEIIHKLGALYPGIHQLAERSKTEDIRIIAEEFKPFFEQIDLLHKQLPDLPIALRFFQKNRTIDHS